MRHATSVSIVIHRAPAEVFAALTDFGKWPQWGGGNLVSMEQISPGPLQVGSQLRQVNKTGRQLTETLVQVTDIAPDQALAMERQNLRGAFTLEATEAGTRLNASFEVEATGLSALMYRLFLKKFVAGDLRNFEALVEVS